MVCFKRIWVIILFLQGNYDLEGISASQKMLRIDYAKTMT